MPSAMTPPVEPDEILFRQVAPHGGTPPLFQSGRQPPIHQNAFLPTRADADGLSLVRPRFRSVIWAAFRPEKQDVRYLLAPKSASVLRDLASSVQLPIEFAPSADGLDEKHGEPFAHCVATSINRTEYDGSPEAKRKIKEWAAALAASLSEGDLRGPFPQPSEDDPYRPAD